MYNYETTILEVEKLDGGLFQIKFGVTPQVGAHNPIAFSAKPVDIEAVLKEADRNMYDMKKKMKAERMD